MKRYSVSPEIIRQDPAGYTSTCSAPSFYVDGMNISDATQRALSVLTSTAVPSTTKIAYSIGIVNVDDVAEYRSVTLDLQDILKGDSSWRKP